MLLTERKVAAALLFLVSHVLAHDHHEDGGMKMGNTSDLIESQPNPLQNYNQFWMPSYAGLSSHQSSIVAHIVLMVIAWFFILPIGVMFSISHSRYSLPVQAFFLVLNGLGVLMGTMYNFQTPGLYENNAHHKIGWIATWVMTAQVIMSLLFYYSGHSKEKSRQLSEHTAFLTMASSHTSHTGLRPFKAYRWSGDSGQGTECSSTDESRAASPTDRNRILKPEDRDLEDDEAEVDEHVPTHPTLRRKGFLSKRILDKCFSQDLSRFSSKRVFRLLEIVHLVIDRTILILGFVALTTGGVTYTGIFRATNVFNGLAHFIKGGIFFWYGLLTLGRWMGCFAEFGWAWNKKPTRSQVGQWKASIPSAEFVESLVIFIYGCSNVFLEHLAAWGDVWTAQDFEHVSISVMFFGGGLCGMLIESSRVRRLLNTSVEVLSAKTDVQSEEAQELHNLPRTYDFPMNPLPALIIMLLGIMMSSHHQDSMVSTMVHKQWGTLLVGFSLSRAVTYIITYISPPTSMFPSRPPSELVSAFCLISGGLIFMASTKDIIYYMEKFNLMAMFLFTVVMGFTAFLMSYEIIVLALKGWAVRKEIQRASKHVQF